MSGFGPPGGGGFGQPPGGGGFGQPPGGGGFGPPPGGGGFGPPPGGGGFGPPPGGDGFEPPGGGGFGPGPSGGGEPQLAHIPFSADDLAHIRRLSLAMMVSAGLLVAAPVLSVIAALISAVTLRGGGGGICFGVLHVIVSLLLAACLFLGASALKRVVETDEADQKHVADGLTQLRNYFMVKGIVYGLAILLLCTCCGISIFMGGLASMLVSQ